MTPEQVFLVQRSWRQVLPIADTAAEMFYTKLFSMDASLKPLFKGEMKTQGRKLMAMIGTAVVGLSKPEALVPTVQDLGRRHVKYGVQDAHYDTVAGALIWTLEQGLGDSFTPDVKSAWVAVYGVLAGTMKDAAAKAAA